MMCLLCRLYLDRTLDSSTNLAIENAFTSLIDSITAEEIDSEVPGPTS